MAASLCRPVVPHRVVQHAAIIPDRDRVLAPHKTALKGYPLGVVEKELEQADSPPEARRMGKKGVQTEGDN